MRSMISIILAAALVSCFVAGCSEKGDPFAPAAGTTDAELQELLARPFAMTGAQPPTPLETVQFGSNSLTFWPFTGGDFSGEGHDPVNLIFFGKADPRDIRAALLSLDGDRSAFEMPPMPPFNSVWDDAIGDVQASYGEPDGWCGGTVQLACGNYAPLRFHLRLFKMGDWTVGNAHFEMLIPGTADHQVLSWEVAEQFVMVDLIRSGILDVDVPMMPTQQINPAPWRTIPAVIYNGLPEELQALIGGPVGQVDEDVPILTDGQALIFNIVGTIPRIPEVRTQDFIIEYGQVVPKPFCAGPDDYVYVQGPVHLIQTTSLSEGGVYHATFRAEGQLAVTPVNPFSGEPIGETLTAEVIEHHDAHFSDNNDWAGSMVSQHLMPDTSPGAGRLFVRMDVRSHGQSRYLAIIRCADNPWEDVTVWNKPPAMMEPRIAPNAEATVVY